MAREQLPVDTGSRDCAAEGVWMACSPTKAAWSPSLTLGRSPHSCPSPPTSDQPSTARRTLPGAFRHSRLRSQPAQRAHRPGLTTSSALEAKPALPAQERMDRDTYSSRFPGLHTVCREGKQHRVQNRPRPTSRRPLCQRTHPAVSTHSPTCLGGPGNPLPCKCSFKGCLDHQIQSCS